jgi:N4-gp56 family major capsid protein
MKMKEVGQKTVNKLIRNDIGFAVAEKATYSANMWQNLAIDGGTLNSSGIAARFWTMTATDGFPMYHNKTRLAQSSTVVSVATSGMTIKTLQHGVKVLRGNDVPTIGGTYKMICHPDVAYQITTNAGFKGWFSPTSAEGGKSDPTVMGIVAGVKVITSTEAYKYPLSGDTLSTSSGNVYGSLLFGEEAYGCAQISGEGNRQGFNFYLKQSGPQSTNDPTNMIKQAAISVTAVGRVLNKSAGLWLITMGL